MEKQTKFGVGVAAVVMAIASTATIAGDLGSAGRSVSEVFGRAGAGYTASNGSTMHRADKMTVSEVSGRGSQVPQFAEVPVHAAALQIAHFGRSTAPVGPVKQWQPQGDTLAQAR